MKFTEFIMESEFRFEGRSVGIITAHNPQGEKAGEKDNHKANQSLWNDLRAAGYDPWSIKGKYAGNEEDSFLVPNISRDKLVSFAKKYDQEAVVFAKKTKSGYQVEWIESGVTKRQERLKNIRSLLSRASA